MSATILPYLIVGTSNWSNFGRLSRRAGVSAIAGLSCFVLRCIDLADRTNGRAYATMLSPSSSVYNVCIVAKRCVLQRKLLLQEAAYEETIGTKINDLDLCLEVV